MLLRNLVIMLTLAGTIFFILVKNPEAQTFVSSDGMLAVEFLAPQGTWIDIVEHDGAYEISSSASVRSAMLHLKTDDTTARFGFFDKAFGMWRLADTDFDEQTNELLTRTTELNTRWRKFFIDEIARPNFDNELASLITASPDRAVGYQVEIGWALNDNAYIILEGQSSSGGCAGEYHYTGETTLTSLEVSFSDTLTYQIVVLWQIGAGCEGYEVVE
ncbi:MAG: hypothetical protein AAB337_02905 [Patescibacteria group bacterium]